MEDLKIITWLARYCTPVLRKLNNVLDYYWALNNDIESLWDGINDDRLKVYTSHEILEYYNKVK